MSRAKRLARKAQYGPTTMIGASTEAMVVDIKKRRAIEEKYRLDRDARDAARILSEMQELNLMSNGGFGGEETVVTRVRELCEKAISDNCANKTKMS